MKETMKRLLPEVYTLSDASGDIDVFLSVVGLTLDDLKVRIDRIPGLAFPRYCPPDFLGCLASLVGAEYDPQRNPSPQRQRIIEAIERYRRCGTYEGLRKELSRLGWKGEIIETFRKILRLNYHARLGRQKLPGHKYNHGIYGITDPINTDEFLQIVLQHQPAGTIVWIGEETASL
ncbi:MAG: phage tail protein [Armatimonadota bacterium]